MKKINIDYNNCLTNLTCSILKYFNCEYKHKTLKILDKYLEKEPKNVVVILCDGMGYNILNKVLPEDSFLRKNLVSSINSVFPSTTTAATTSVITGLNPYEHCWLGWEIYLKELDEVVIMFKNTIKDTEESLGKENLCHKYMGYKTIFDQINEKENSSATYISSFSNETFDTIDEMNELIKSNLNKKEKNYIYAYYKNPDQIMHEYGAISNESIQNIKMLNEKLEKLCNELKDTLVIIIADHGHINNQNYYLEDYKEIYDCLKRTTSIDARSAMYFIKDDMKDKFKELFTKTFNDEFILLSKEEIYNINLFGDGNKHPHFDSCIGDFISISTKDKGIKYNRIIGKQEMKSTHAGNTLDEMLVPLIIIEK